MRLVPTATCMLAAAIVSSARAADVSTFVEYQGQRVELARAYVDFDAYSSDPDNLSPVQARHVETLMRAARIGPRFASDEALTRALFELQFPGYGFFEANQLGAHLDPKLELVSLEIPKRALNRYVALEKQADGSLVVVDDFVAADQPEITRVSRTANGQLAYKTTGGQAVVPSRR